MVIISKTDKVRAFIKKMPRLKYVTERDISDKFGLKRQTVFFIMKNIEAQKVLKSRLDWQPRDNGRKYQVRIYWKP